MAGETTTVGRSAPTSQQGYGLRRGALPQWATVAQSLSSIAPTASPAMVIPLVVAVSGRSSWLAYLVATIAASLVALHINVFARSSASPGSLYAFVHDELGFWPGLLAGWAVLIAYIGTASAVTAGIVQYAQGAFGGLWPRASGGTVLIVASVAIATILAYKNVELSARFMLAVEAASIALILLLFFHPSATHRLFFDRSQFTPEVFHLEPIRAGLILATFSFVGFESATALGAEAHSPLTTIPRAVLSTAIVSGALFIFSAYAEVASFGGKLDVLTESSAPLQLLAQLKGVAWLGPLLTVGAITSFFACTLACITAGARAALLISTQGALPALLNRTHRQNQTPHVAVVACGIAASLPAAWLTIRHVSAFDVYGWVGTIATFGFVTAYVLVVAAALEHLRCAKELNWARAVIAVATLFFLCWAFASSLNLGSKGPERWFAPAFFALLASGILLGVVFRRFGTPDRSARTAGVHD
jgi:amino acid transporter